MKLLTSFNRKHAARIKFTFDSGMRNTGVSSREIGAEKFSRNLGKAISRFAVNLCRDPGNFFFILRVSVVLISIIPT